MSNEELRQLAMAATPGPWNLGLTSGEIRMVLSGDSYICHVQVHQTPRSCGEWQERQRIANTAYLAAANPAAVLALLDENARLRETLGTIAAGLDTFAINPSGLPNIVVEGGSRFAHERDVLPMIYAAREALEVKP
jgi:hypothetical protein